VLLLEVLIEVAVLYNLACDSKYKAYIISSYKGKVLRYYLFYNLGEK
jgi:hypothetical protein